LGAVIRHICGNLFGRHGYESTASLANMESNMICRKADVNFPVVCSSCAERRRWPSPLDCCAVGRSAQKILRIGWPKNLAAAAEEVSALRSDGRQIKHWLSAWYERR